MAQAGDLAPGTALDAVCGEGTDAIWLASRGWQVTAVDFATIALRRAREHADTFGADITRRIDWVQADLTSWTPTEEHFDLVSAHYVHPATSPRGTVPPAGGIGRAGRQAAHRRPPPVGSTDHDLARFITRGGLHSRGIMPTPIQSSPPFAP